MNITKRKLLNLLALLPSLGACVDTNPYGKPIVQPPDPYGSNDALRKRFKGVSVGELVLDALTPKAGVIFYDHQNRLIEMGGGFGPKGSSKSAYPGGERGVPISVRATWREGKFEMAPSGNDWIGGVIVGDYSVTVAERIPEETLNYIRRNKTSLRLKFRLYDEGLLVGWDVPKPFVGERVAGRYYPVEYFLIGGDFQEAHIVNGQVVRKGWYINKQGQRIETEW